MGKDSPGEESRPVNYLPAIALLLCTALLASLPLLPALFEWWFRTDIEPLRVVRKQDSDIRHFARSFKSLVTEIISEHQHAVLDRSSFDGVWRERESFSLIAGDLSLKLHDETKRTRLVDKLLIGLGNLSIPGKTVYEQEVYAAGNLRTGEDSTFRAVYAAGRLNLRSRSTVARWCHGEDIIHAHSRCQLFGRASCDRILVLDHGCVFERILAPVIQVSGCQGMTLGPLSDPPQTHWPIPDEGIQLDPNTYLFHHSLELPAGGVVEGNLIIKGTLRIRDNCTIRGSLKAYSNIRIGTECRIEGAVVSQRSIRVAPASAIRGAVIAEDRLRLEARCVIGTRDLPTTVTAPRIRLSEGVRIYGTARASSTGRVVVRGA